MVKKHGLKKEMAVRKQAVTKERDLGSGKETGDHGRKGERTEGN